MPSGQKHSGEHHILTILGGLIDSSGQLDFALPSLVEQTHLSKRQVQRLLQSLHEQRRIEYQPGRGKGKKSHLLVMGGKGDILSDPQKVTFYPPEQKGDILQKVTFSSAEMSPFGEGSKGDILPDPQKVTFSPATAPSSQVKGDISPLPEKVTFPTSEAYPGPGPDHDLEIQDPKGSARMSPFRRNVTFSKESPFSKRSGNGSTPPPVPPSPSQPCGVVHLHGIIGKLRDPRYVWVGRHINPSIGALMNPWTMPYVIINREDESDFKSVREITAYVRSKPDLVAALPTLRGKQLVYDVAGDRDWASTLAELANRPDGELAKLLPKGHELADPPPSPEAIIRKAGAIPRYSHTGKVHAALAATDRNVHCGQANDRLEDAPPPNVRLSICQTCERALGGGTLVPHVAIIYAWHESIPDEIRPPGKPPVAPNAHDASALRNAGITPDQVRQFMAERYPGYLSWAAEKGAPSLMSLAYVRKNIKAHFNGAALAKKMNGQNHADPHDTDDDEDWLTLPVRKQESFTDED